MKTTTAITIKSLNDRLYRAARKAGFEQALFYAHVEVTDWTAGASAPAEPYITWNHDHEPSDDVAPLDMTAIKRAEAWLAKALAAASPWQITVESLEGDNDLCEELTGKVLALFSEADEVLRKVARQAPAPLAYDKVHFTVKHLPSGAEWGARVDVSSLAHVAAPKLREHMIASARSNLSEQTARILADCPNRLAEARAAGKLWTELLSCDHPSNADELALAASEMKQAKLA